MAEPGTVPRVLLERYELRERAGVGGMGEVWLGWDRRLQRDVAVKLLLPQLSDEPSFRERFAVEARAAAALDHPNVVRVFDIDEDGGTLFIVMERLPGPSLDRVIAESGPLSEDDVHRVAADMLAALGAAHAENLVHRDIKPGNLIKGAGGRWKVGDFGVAKDLASTAHLTLVGVAVGTPAYLAPEQLDGRPSTYAADLWAAAVVLREALAGRRPFEGNDPIEVAHAVQSTVVPPLGSIRPDVSPALAAALDRALSYDPRNRFPTAQAMADAIEGRTADVLVAPSAVPSPPPSVSGEVPALAAPAVSGERPAVPPAVPPASAPAGPAAPAPAGEGSTARTVGLAAIAVGTILVLFLLGLLFGLVMVTGSDGDDDGSEVDPAPATSEATDADPSASTTPSAPTTEPRVMPGDGPLPGVTTPSTTLPPPASTGGEEGDAEAQPDGAEPPSGDVGQGDDTAPDPGLPGGSFG